jgi:hypothetical protein
LLVGAATFAAGGLVAAGVIEFEVSDQAAVDEDVRSCSVDDDKCESSVVLDTDVDHETVGVHASVGLHEDLQVL